MVLSVYDTIGVNVAIPVLSMILAILVYEAWCFLFTHIYSSFIKLYRIRNLR
jgi:hypothetical protein